MSWNEIPKRKIGPLNICHRHYCTVMSITGILTIHAPPKLRHRSPTRIHTSDTLTKNIWQNVKWLWSNHCARFQVGPASIANARHIKKSFWQHVNWAWSEALGTISSWCDQTHWPKLQMEVLLIGTPMELSNPPWILLNGCHRHYCTVMSITKNRFPEIFEA